MRFKHLGVAVANMATAVELYTDLFGYEVVMRPVDDPIQKVSVCFVASRSENFVVEIVCPADTSSPINQILRKGIGAYHVCYEVARIDEALQQARDKGCLVVSHPVSAAAFDGRRIAWFYTPTRQLVELLEA